MHDLITCSFQVLCTHARRHGVLSMKLKIHLHEEVEEEEVKEEEK